MHPAVLKVCLALAGRRPDASAILAEMPPILPQEVSATCRFSKPGLQHLSSGGAADTGHQTLQDSAAKGKGYEVLRTHHGSVIEFFCHFWADERPDSSAPRCMFAEKDQLSLCSFWQRQATRGAAVLGLWSQASPHRCQHGTIRAAWASARRQASTPPATVTAPAKQAASACGRPHAALGKAPAAKLIQTVSSSSSSRLGSRASPHTRNGAACGLKRTHRYPVSNAGLAVYTGAGCALRGHSSYGDSQYTALSQSRMMCCRCISAVLYVGDANMCNTSV